MTSSFLSDFAGMWRRPASDYDRGISEYLVVLDTNVLLELYRFTPGARNELITVLERLKDRLWIPNQVGREYYERRVDAIKEHLDLYSSTPKLLSESKDKAILALNTFARRCSISGGDREQLTAPIEAAFKKVTAAIEERRNAFDLDLAKVVTRDPILESLAGILDGKTGTPFDPEEAALLVEKFKERAEAGIPPGFEDTGKADNAHGDFFVWEQLLREAKERNLPVLFVTNDEKRDWVRKEAGIVVGPRPELISEFSERCGSDFLLVNLVLFLRIAKERLGVAVSASTVAQAESVRHGIAPARKYSLSREEYEAVLTHMTADHQKIGRSIRNGATGKDLKAQSRFLTRLLGTLEGGATIAGDNVTVFASPDQWSYIEWCRDITSAPPADMNGLPRSAARNKVDPLYGELDFVHSELAAAHAHREFVSYERSDAMMRAEHGDFAAAEEMLLEVDQRIAALEVRAGYLRGQIADRKQSGKARASGPDGNPESAP
ncbi:PIN domain-containing protein [Streptomyces erythrochromogenes]|uniref:PIN domain-containing protein n=1 Tax=Streptomyces erythrochromogenes TaxID=285574 RepID=UPI00386356C8|nr:PIN domain-containing protein [Streptomyces erythrochromogenes]